MKVKRQVSRSPGLQGVALVDDHTFMREGIKNVIDSLDGYFCMWTAANADEAMAQLAEKKPDILITDITLPGRSGLDLVKEVHALHPTLPILVLSMHQEEIYAQRAVKSGARGYLMKSAEYESFAQALRKISAGRVWLSEAVSDSILRTFTNGAAPKNGDGLDALTEREFEVFQSMAEGKTTSKIAEAMDISPKTVDVHRSNIRAKLQLGDGVSLMHYAIRWGESRRLDAGLKS
ncbi:MAG TPA: response regulator transcription factor [Candidatus Saccharimonadia bacterium]|nr:response regulator transcription factor [Candidatus Saccharimonadia bacterium]